MDWVVAPPGVQRLPDALEEVSTTLPPAQKVVGPPGVMVGAEGSGFTVTVMAFDTGEGQPLLTMQV